MLGYKYSVPDIAGYKTYGRLRLTVTSPVQTFVEPITLYEVKTGMQLYSDHADTYVEQLAIAAREVAEVYCGFDLVAKQYDLTLDRWPDEIRLRAPLATVDSFSWKDSAGTSTSMVAGTGYVVDTIRALMVPPWGAIWPMRAPLYPSGSILVRFTTQAEPLTYMWRVGIIQLVRHWFDQGLAYEIARGTVQSLPFNPEQLFNIGSNRIFG
jgi:uncharacterized phiE125 gp8 family phage protein